MDKTRFRRSTANDNLISPVRGRARPARAAASAVAIAFTATLVAVSGASAGSGGTVHSGGGTSADDGGTGTCPATELGTRTLEVGDCGDDVRTLNWILKSKRLAGTLADRFGTSTESAVREFERSAGIEADGVVQPATHAALANSLPSQLATWYGPGFFGNRTACGETLTKTTVGVAHKTLPCGSKVVLRYKGSYLRTTVIDRGPFANGAKWDLTEAAAERVGFEATDEIRVATLARAKHK